MPKFISGLWLLSVASILSFIGFFYVMQSSFSIYLNKEQNSCMESDNKPQDIHRFFQERHDMNESFNICLQHTFQSQSISKNSSCLFKQVEYLKAIELFLVKKMTNMKKLSSVCQPKVYIYRCHEPLCGGLGDRIKGLIFSFYWSLLLGYTLHFRLDFPSHFHDYFKPAHEHCWSIDLPQELSNENNPNIKRQILNFIDYHSQEKKFTETDFAKSWKDFDVTEVRTNVDGWTWFLDNPFFKGKIDTYFPFLRGLDKLQMAHIVMRMFFKPQLFLEENANSVLGNTDSSTLKIGIQHRIGDEQFGRKGWIRHSLKSAECFARKALEICKSMAEKIKTCLFFITADSKKGLEIIRETIQKYTYGVIFRIVETRGTVNHIDAIPPGIQVENPKEFYLKTYLDWKLLTMMDILVISRSGFGETASWMSLAKTYAYRESKSQTCDFVDYLLAASGEQKPAY